MYFELQMSASVFTRVVRNRLRSIPLGVDASFPDPDAGTLVVDQVVIGDTTTLQREQTVDYSSGVAKITNVATQVVWTFSPTNLTNFIVPYVQVRQEVRVLLVRASDLAKNGPAPTAPFRTLTIFPVFNIALKADKQTQGGGPLTLSYTLAYIDYGVAGLAIDPALRAGIAQVIGGVAIEPATVSLTGLDKLLDRHVNAINAGIACDVNGTRVALRADFDVYASPLAIERAFFEMGPADLLGGQEWAMLMDANVLMQEGVKQVRKGLETESNLRIRSGPEATWDAGEATVRIGADIRLLGACPAPVDDINMDVKVEVGGRFSVTATHNLHTHFQLDGVKNNPGQVFGCALTGALLYPFFGTALFAKGKIDLVEYFGGIAFGPFFTFGQLVGVINAQKLEKDISDTLKGTCHKVNDSEYECDTAGNMPIQLVPTLNSTLVLEHVRGVPEGLVLAGPIVNLGELFLGSIGDIGQRPFKWQVLGHCTGNRKSNFHVGNEATIFVSYTPPARVLKARVFSDPQNGYALTVNDNELSVTPSDPPVSYACQIRLITNRGVRTLTIPPAARITAAEADALRTAVLGAGLTCFYWEKEFTEIEKVLWLVDPAHQVINERAVRQWQILLRDLDPGTRLTVRLPDGTTVATARPSRSRSLRLSLMFADRGGPADLSLELDRPGRGAVSPIELAVHQTLYDLRATLPVRGDVRNIELKGTLRRPQLGIVTDGEVLRWDVRNPLAPQLLEATTRGPVDPRDDEHDWMPHHGYEACHSDTPYIVRALKSLHKRLGQIHAVGVVDVVSDDHTLYLRTAQGSAVYDVSGPDEPEEMHTLSTPGAYEDTAASVNLMARHDRERGVIDLFEIVAQHTV